MTVITMDSQNFFAGLAADTRPDAPYGARYLAYDTGIWYVNTPAGWVIQSSGIARAADVASLIIADNEAISDALDMRSFAGGLVLLPAAWIAANCGFQVSDAQAGTYAILRDDVGAPVQISGISTSAARWYKLPDALFGAHFVKLWSKSTTAATETDTNQTGGPLTVTVLLKG